MAAPFRLTGLVVGDDPAAWAAMGFPVLGDRLTVGGVTIRLVGSHGPRGIRGWQLDPPLDVEVDGLPAERANGDRDDLADAPSGRGYAVAAVDHVVVTTPDVERTTRALASLGLEPLRTVGDARGDDGVRSRFWTLGTCLLEAVGPTVPSGEGLARFRGLTFTAPDLRAFADVADAPRPAIQPGREVATIRTEEFDVSVPVAILTPRPPRDHGSADQSWPINAIG